MFIDTATINVKAGDGGNGCVSFHREKYVANGGPDGGDGGKGGNIVFRTDSNISTLAGFRYKRKYIAENGVNGRANKCSGKNAPDLIINVPPGTLVKEAESGRLLADLSDGEPKVIAKGGNGGWGNQHFATPTRQAPRFAKPGLPGEQYELRLELKLLADVGLAGFPNVGKSTLISVISEAKPVIANYHFTTITPVLGVVNYAEDSSFVVADIPGLIEGAGEGAGLGHQFLRHIERCRMIIHIVDVSGSEGRDPIEDFRTINAELARFNPELAERPMIVAGNKIDMADEEQIQRFADFVKKGGYEFFPISAAAMQNLQPLLDKTAEMLSALPPVKVYEPDPVVLEVKDNRAYSIAVEDGVYHIEGEWLLTLLGSVNMDDYSSLQYFQRTLISAGIIDALRVAGITEGDTVSIYGFEFDFVE